MSTSWPLRQALSLTLRRKIVEDALPAINAGLAAQMISRNSAKVVAFGDANVIIGSPVGISEPTITIAVSRETISPVASDSFRDVFETAISIKVPWAADNAPEDFALVADIVLDNLRDLLTSAENYTIRPLDPGGAPILPGDAQFVSCRVTHIVHDPPSSDGAGIANIQSWTLTHTAEAAFYS